MSAAASLLPEPTLPRGFIEQWLDHSAGQRSPPIFRLWAGISIISGAAERRVWTETGSASPLYPNLYVFLVARPGRGKSQALLEAGNLLRLAGFHAPNDITKQAGLDHLKKSAKAVQINGELIEYHFVAYVIDELSDLMSDYNSEIAGSLTRLWDCPPVNDEQRRSSAASGLLLNPGVSLFAGTSTKNLGSTINPALWGQGFMARVILVHSDASVTRSFFGTVEGIAPTPRRVIEASRKRLQVALERIADLRGPMIWDAEATDWFDNWTVSGCLPEPTHPKLEEYVTRRPTQLAKLCMISALSNYRCRILKSDYDRALRWLVEAEATLPEMFSGMTTTSDSSIMDELVEITRTTAARTGLSVPAVLLSNFLRDRVGHTKIKSMLDAAESAGLIEREAGSSGQLARYVPKEKTVP